MFPVGKSVRVIKRSCRQVHCLGSENGCIGKIGSVIGIDRDNFEDRIVNVKFPQGGWCNLKESEIILVVGAKEELE